jgi:peptidoglycan/LPS O-acetylase OafA/YrhL
MEARLLRTAFLVGAVTDALALVPMLSPWAARVLWGFDDPTGSYRFAMGYGASLMLGWTALLVWAHRRPIERRGVAALTVLVIYGLVITEVAAVVAGDLEASRMVPTWCLQAGLLALFASAYHYSTLARWFPAHLARER